MRAYAPFFDPHLSWYPDAWAYQDLYAVYADDREDGSNLRYVLKDVLGRPPHIPWGCEGGACPQFAGHPGDPRFRARWIAAAREKLSMAVTWPTTRRSSRASMPSPQPTSSARSHPSGSARRINGW